MKRIITTITFISLTLVFFTGCKKQIDEAYASPNADVRVAVETLLPPIIASMAGNAAGHGTLNDIRHIGKYIQNWQFVNAGVLGSVNRDDQMGYYVNTDCAGSVWRMHYYDIGQNLNNMIIWATEEKKWDYVGVGKAIFAWSWLTLTDYHGEVILKEALNPALITFKFDTQPEVYEYVRQLCFEALEYLGKTGDAVSPANLAKGDEFFYNGDVNKWKKFVYGILARSHHHLTNKTDYKADSVVYYADKSITTVADNASVKYAYAGGLTGSANFFGPIRNNFSITTVGTTCETAVRQSAYIANLLTGLNSRFPTGTIDPRAIYMLRLNKNGTFKGLTPNKGQNALGANDRPENFFGLDQSVSQNNGAPATDNNCRYIFTNTAPTPILTSTEIFFMKAEALYRQGKKDEARTAYIKAISEDFDMLTTVYNKNIPAGMEITPATKAAYLANPVVVPPTGSELTLSHIMLQKYIALFGFGVLETWVDMRRYHYVDKEANGLQVYADFVPPPSPTDLFPDNKGKLVYRVRPRFNSEYVWNKNELVRIGADQIDYHTKEPWFVIK
jgi:hypothetical protein